MDYLGSTVAFFTAVDSLSGPYRSYKFPVMDLKAYVCWLSLVDSDLFKLFVSCSQSLLIVIMMVNIADENAITFVNVRNNLKRTLKTFRPNNFRHHHFFFKSQLSDGFLMVHGSAPATPAET